MSLKLNSSGGGSVTLQEPVTASTLTLTLPAFSGTAATLASVTNNGVLFVNGSGQPTSGSALTFDGTSLGVGMTPSGDSRFEVYGADAATIYKNVNTGTGLSDGFYVGMAKSSGTDGYVYNRESANVIFGTANAERARIDSSGNLLVGATSLVDANYAMEIRRDSGSAGLMLHTAGGGGRIGYLTNNRSGTFDIGSATNSGGLLSFSTSAVGSDTLTERARIDSSGNLLVGTTSGIATARMALAASASTNGFCVRAGDTANLNFIGRNSADSNTFLVFGNGNVQNSNNSYGSISDAKLKENVTDATPKLEKLQQVRVVNFNMKGDEQKQIGVIAQELEQVFPGMVEESPDRDKDGNDLGTTTKSVKYSVFVPMLIKAIQEQQAMIAQLQADIASLKGTA